MKAKYTLIGKVTGLFGIKGELKIKSESDFIFYRFKKGATIYFSDEEAHKVTSSRIHKGNVLITIDELYDINLVERFVGMNVFAIATDTPPLSKNEYYIDDLVGLEVFNQKNELLGKVSDVIEMPSSYLLEVVLDGENRKILIPFVDAFVKEVTNEKIIIEEIEGLR